MSKITGTYGPLLKKITAAGLMPLLLVAGLPPPAPGAALNCQGWNTEKYFATATVDQARACLSAGKDPNKPDTQGLTVLLWTARKSCDPAVIEAVLVAGANLRAPHPRATALGAVTAPWPSHRTFNEVAEPRTGFVPVEGYWSEEEAPHVARRTHHDPPSFPVPEAIRDT